MQKKQGSGSVWNVNSWHWEMKNYSEISKKILQQKILDLKLFVSQSMVIQHSKVKFNTAESEVNIRKGKQILVYEFDLELTVQCKHQSQDDCDGSYRIKEILSDDLNDMIIDQIKSTTKNKTADEMKKWLKKNVKDHIIKIFKLYEKQLMDLQGDPQKLEQDRKKRQQLTKATKQALQKKGAQKQRLFQEQKNKEIKMKQQAYQKNIQRQKSN